jgi:hypothetical protein
MRVTPALGAVTLALVVAPATQSPLNPATQSPIHCRTTPPNGNVPSGVPTSLFGNGRLATIAYREIAVTLRTRNPDGSIGEKFPWWAAPDVTGDLVISGHRLDRPGGPVTGRVNPGFVESNPNRFWAVGVRFPTVGCWKVTGTVGVESLSLVVRVAR